MKNPLGKFFNRDPKESERASIEKEVERKKERCRKLGVNVFMGKIFNEISHYPAWFKNKNAPLEITNVKELEKIEGFKEWNRIQFTLYGNDYICAYEEHLSYAPDPEPDNEKYGTFELYIKDKKVLSLSMSYSFDPIYSEWKAFGIEAFVEGEWVNAFKKFYEASEKRRAEFLKNLGHKAPDELKKDFGI